MNSTFNKKDKVKTLVCEMIGYMNAKLSAEWNIQRRYFFSLYLSSIDFIYNFDEHFINKT